jgi:vacuolar protein sorting-associated protein 26
MINIYNNINSLQSFLFKPPCQIDIELDDKDKRSTVDIRRENGSVEKLFLFVGDEPVKGKVLVTVHPGKKIEHNGIKIELLGQIGNISYSAISD